jgi:chromatin assembly factor 1 subunit B
MIFAVVTITAVMVYDTQMLHPIARFGGLHLACINDATWSADGRMLVVCSSDGYLSFFRFPEGSLGERRFMYVYI